MHDPQGAPQSVATNATTSYSYLHDQQDSVTAVVNSTGALTSEYTYGTFGTSTKSPNDPAGGEKSAFGFDLRARTLDTTTGRFTTRDPVATTPGNPNPSDYAYADNDPVNESDPSAACPVCISALVGAGIGGLVSGGIYAWQHHDGDGNRSDFAATTAKAPSSASAQGSSPPSAAPAQPSSASKTAPPRTRPPPPTSTDSPRPPTPGPSTPSNANPPPPKTSSSASPAASAAPTQGLQHVRSQY